MKIEVTQFHIETGIQCSLFCCPIALAVMSKYFKRGRKVSVCVNSFSITVQPLKIRPSDPRRSKIVYRLPREAAKFVEKYDRLGALTPKGRQRFKPFEFEARKCG